MPEQGVVYNMLVFVQGHISMLKTLHLEKGFITEEECSRVSEAGHRWFDELARTIALKPPGVVKLVTDVLEEYKKEEWYSWTANRVKVVSELYQEKLLTENEVKRMKVEGGDLLYQRIPLQCTKPPEMVTRIADVMSKFGHNEEAMQLRVLNELFTRHLLTAEECSEVAGRWVWQDHLVRVMSTKPAEVVQEALKVLNKHLKGMDRGHLGLTSDLGHGPSTVSTDSGYGQSAQSTDVEYRGPSVAASIHSLSSLARQYQKMRTHPHEEESFLSLSSEEEEVAVTVQRAKVPSQPAGGGSDPPKDPDADAVKAAETDLDNLCWILFGVQSQSVGPEGGRLCLRPSVGEEEGQTILLEVPSGAVNPSESVEVRSAVIPYGPFKLPEGYQLASMVVYINYNGQRLTKPLILRLRHWYGGENHVRDGLSFAKAPHTPKERERVYQFHLLEGGRRLSSSCWELEIDDHCSLFAEVFKKGAISHYQAIALEKPEGDETTCDVAVTYAFPLWCEILSKYRYGWTAGKPSCSFTFGEDGLKGKLKKESGNGWQSAISGSSKLKPVEVEYNSHGITSPKLLKVAVLNRGYPPSITFAVTYKEELRRTGKPVWVQLDLLGAGENLTFMCKAYEEENHKQLDRSRNAAAASQSPLTPPPDMVNDLHSTASLHAETAAPLSVSEFFEKHETEFFRVVNPRFSLMRLRRKGVISQDVASRISAATNEEDAQEILFAHLSHSADVKALREYCEVIIAADGLPKMQSFGMTMKEELQQGGKQTS